MLIKSIKIIALLGLVFLMTNCNSTPIKTSSLTAKAYGDNRVKLRWQMNTSVTEADDIYIERSVDGNQFDVINAVSCPATYLDDFQLQQKTTYWYRVRLYRLNGGFANYSDVASVKTSSQ